MCVGYSSGTGRNGTGRQRQQPHRELTQTRHRVEPRDTTDAGALCFPFVW